MQRMTRWLGGCLLMACGLTLGGCSSLISETASATAGIASGSLAGAVTNNAGVAAGIGIGVQAGIRSGVQFAQRKIHGEAQQQIADVAGPLEVGQVKNWNTVLSVPLEYSEAGKVTASRVISTGELDCKEIVVSVERRGGETLPASEFYVASVCRSGSQWAWASAEPATPRWGAMQ
jgi:hypothetical protein